MTSVDNINQLVWRCTYCGNDNAATSQACERCGVRGVIKADPKSKSQAVFGVVVIVLLIGALLAGFL